MQQPTVGRIVHYQIGSGDAEQINRRRRDASAFMRTLATVIEPGDHGRTGHVLHVGNEVCAGDVYPAIVVRVFDGAGSTANLKVLLDGSDDYWATSCSEGGSPGFWSWPPREHTAADSISGDSEPESGDDVVSLT